MAEHRLWSRAKALFGRSIPAPEPDRKIEVTPIGFEVRGPGSEIPEYAIRWDEIQRIRTYKLDLHSFDCICLLFETQGTPPAQVSEEWDGFVGLMEQMRLRFPSIPSDWYETVMLPAFERNEAILFEKR